MIMCIRKKLICSNSYITKENMNPVSASAATLHTYREPAPKKCTNTGMNDIPGAGAHAV